MKYCKDCNFYKDKEAGDILGKCKFPVPAWVYESRYVNGYEAGACLVYESETPDSKKGSGQ